MKKYSSPKSLDANEPYVMRVADLLSDDPMLTGLLGPSFKVIVDYDTERMRVTYAFRRSDDTGDEEVGARFS